MNLLPFGVEILQYDEVDSDRLHQAFGHATVAQA